VWGPDRPVVALPRPAYRAEDPDRTTTVPRAWGDGRIPFERARVRVTEEPDGAVEPNFAVPGGLPNPFRRAAPANPLDGYEWIIENRSGLFGASVNGAVTLLPRFAFEQYSRLMSENDNYERVGPMYVRRDILPRVRTNPDGTIMVGEVKLSPREWTEDEKRIVPGKKHMRTAAKMWNKH